MANNLTGWLTIDRLNGEGNSVVTLNASTLATLGERNASLKIKTSSKEAIINLYQQHYEEPLIPDNIPNNQIWAKSTDGTIIDEFHPDSNFNVNLIEVELRLDGWSILTFDGDIRYIPNDMFYDFHSIKEVVIPKSVTSIGNSAFYNCRYLKSIYIPEGVTSIGRSAFYYCIYLTEITIPDSVTTIENSAFSDCQRLTSVDLGNGVTTIGGGAFYNCTSLAEITIPNSVTTIDGSIFSRCRALTSVVLGNSVTSIGNRAFENCKSLTEITCKAIVAPTIYEQTFATIASNGVLKYPSGSDYSKWLSSNRYYLGYYGWTGVPY